MIKRFDEMMEIVHRLQEKLRQFLDISQNLSFQESHTELTKCFEYTDKIDEKLKDKVQLKTDSDDRCTDFAAELMCQYLSLMYEKAVLLIYTSRLKEELSKATKSKKKKHVNKFAKS